MRLAIIGENGDITRAVAKHGTKLGYEVKSAHDPASKPAQLMDALYSDLVRHADAVLLVLHDEMHVFDKAAAKLVSLVVTSMRDHGKHRLVMTSNVHSKKSDATSDSSDSCVSIMRDSGLDWTIIGHHPLTNEQRKHDQIAKAALGQITESRHIGSIVILPA